MSARARLDGQRFDVIVVGGGINGVAIARECALAGRRTLLLEQRDFASGTTSRSTRIIHGGLRYLEHAELGMVRDALRERDRLLSNRAHLVRPVRFLLALKPGGRHSALAVRAGLWLYRSITRAGAGAVNGQAQRLRRLLDSAQRWSIFSYDDAQCEFPERLVAEWLTEALAAGALARNYTELLEITVSGGRARGVRFRDLLTKSEDRAEAGWMVNAAGPWADVVCSRSGISRKRMVGGVRGSHLILPRFPGMPESAVYSEAIDGRPIFLVPWNQQLLLGTTEVADDDDPARTQPSQAEVDYLFRSFRKLFPAAPVQAEQVRHAFAGVRALPFAPGKKASSITRRHFLYDHQDDGAAGVISVIGGKLTTAASLARECARKMGIAVEDPAPLMVAPAPTDGIESSLAHWARQMAGTNKISEASAWAIAEWHGRCAMHIARLAGADPRFGAPLCLHSPHLAAEAVAAVHYECAATLGDILLRRVPVALGACWSPECTRAAAASVGAALGWGESRVQQEIERFEEERQSFLHTARPSPSAADLSVPAEGAA